MKLRRWFQFRLRTLVVGVVLIGAACGYVGQEYRIAAARRDWLQRHPQPDRVWGIDNRLSPPLPWIRHMMGDRLRQNIVVATEPEQQSARRLFPEGEIWVDLPASRLNNLCH